MNQQFAYLKANASRFLANPEGCLTKDGLIDLICRNCEFWHEDEVNYECGAFKLMRLLLEKEMLSIETIVHAIQE